MKHELLAKAMQMNIDHCVKNGVVPKPFFELPESTQKLLLGRARREMKTARSAPTGSASLPPMMDEPWPLRDILAKLVEAADILLDEKDYDGHGWEQIAGCRDRAKAILATQNDGFSGSLGSGAEGSRVGALPGTRN